MMMIISFYQEQFSTGMPYQPHRKPILPAVAQFSSDVGQVAHLSLRHLYSVIFSSPEPKAHWWAYSMISLCFCRQ